MASDRDGDDDAIIVVTDPRQREVRQRRPSGGATVEGTPQFYPGDNASPMAGAYTIKVTVGARHDLRGGPLPVRTAVRRRAMTELKPKGFRHSLRR